MYFLGHLGIGSKLVSPLSKGLPFRWVLVGTVLPDLIDKPLYYALSWLTGKAGAELGLISGGRTFGHTALFVIALALLAFARRSRVAAALAAGVASHLLLDTISDQFYSRGAVDGLAALLWPLLGPFPVMPYKTGGEQLAMVFHPFIFGAEVVGALILGWEMWKRKHRYDFPASLRRRRLVRR